MTSRRQHNFVQGRRKEEEQEEKQEPNWIATTLDTIVRTLESRWTCLLFFVVYVVYLANRSRDLVTTDVVGQLVTQQFSSQADQAVRNFDLQQQQLAAIVASAQAYNDKIRLVQDVVRQNYIDAAKPLVANLTEFARAIDARVKNESRRIVDNVIANRKSSANVYNRIAIQRELENASWAIWHQINQTVDVMAAQQGKK